MSNQKQLRQRFTDELVLIIGASGGLGAAYARAFAGEGARLLLTARDLASIEDIAAEVSAVEQLPLDLADEASIQSVARHIEANYPQLRIIVNATGFDVRKAFVDHSLQDIDRSLSVNLRGSMLLTKAFLPMLLRKKDGVILHMGGFADGRLAFPFYAVDVASRAGLRGFIDAVNRENAGTGVVVSYFSPSPADTEAERPFHALWQQLNIAIVSPTQVAKELLDTVAHKRSVHVMGGWLTRLFAQINAVSPALADMLAMGSYRNKIQRFLQGSSVPAPVASPLRVLGIALIVASFILYGIGLLVIPFLPLETGAKALLVPSALGLGELIFWIGALLVGREIVTKYRRCLNPCNWFSSNVQ